MSYPACMSCGGTGHYTPVHPHCEPCNCEWECYACEGSGVREYRFGQNPSPFRPGNTRVKHPLDGTVHRGNDRVECVGCDLTGGT